MPKKSAKQEQDKNQRNIISDDSMKGAIKRALSSGRDYATSPMLPERDFGSNKTWYPFSANTPVLGNIGIPSFGSIYDTIREYSSPMNMANLAMTNTAPYGNLQQIGENLKQSEQFPLPTSALPPEMVAPGMETEFNIPRRAATKAPGMTDQRVYDLARKKFNMGKDMPAPTPSYWWTNRRPVGN